MLRHLALIATALLTLAPAARAQASAAGIDGPVTVEPASMAAGRELVVVLHGLGRTARSMRPVEEALEAAGFDVLNIGYSSYCCTIPELGEAVRRELDAKRKPEHTRVHFVGHSLGNIIARWIVSQPSPPSGVTRLVMLAPPNQGSKTADRFTPMVGWLLEPIDELRTDSSATVRQLAPLTGVQIGIIAGRHDGTVSLDETHVSGETAHVVVKANHTFIMREAEVHRLTVEFLRTGRFTAPLAVR